MPLAVSHSRTLLFVNSFIMVEFHLTSRISNSDWFVCSFRVVVWGNIFLLFDHNLLSELKQSFLKAFCVSHSQQDLQCNSYDS